MPNSQIACVFLTVFYYYSAEVYIGQSHRIPR